MKTYDQFIADKSQLGGSSGFEPVWMPDFLFDFQKALVDWSIGKGRSATFADCGLGKTPMQLVWAENIVRKTNKPNLIITPLAVGAQTIQEGEKFGIEARQSRDGKAHPGINVTNYERIHLFNRNDFGSVVCDESSAIKSFTGKHRALVTDFMRKMPFRHLCTATAAPNDYIELGTSSEALGELGYTDMLTRFFKNDQNTIKPMKYRERNKNLAKVDERAKWRFKGHAEEHFWRWVASWARAMRKPSDLGFDDSRFVLPPLIEREHVVESRTLPDGYLLPMEAVGLFEERGEQRRTISERCEMVAELVNKTGQPAVTWCHLNPEGDLLEKLIPDAVQVSGSDSTDRKEEILTAFTRGEIRVLVTKPKIGAWGLNWQHCNHMTFFPSHSFEQYYQGVRRCWRFGQNRPVTVDIVATDSGARVMHNLKRKAEAADRMFTALVRHMNDAVGIRRTESFTNNTEVPSWI